MQLKHILHLSGGIASWNALLRVVEREGPSDVVCLFADTYMEDEDLYRFLIQGTAHVYSRLEHPKVLEALRLCKKIPTIESGRLVERKEILRRIRVLATSGVPALRWIAEGRTPWEVYNDVKFLGNSRIDPCSRILKRELLDRWVEKWCDPTNTVHYFGLDWSEPGRVQELDRIMSLKGLDCDFPLNWKPHLSKYDYLNQARCRKIEPPRLYQWGFPHNNCGGFCCKSGQASLKLLLIHLPQRYAFHEEQEQLIRNELGNVAVMRDRTGGNVRPLTMKEFRQRFESTGECDETDKGACSCFGRTGQR